jgi:hypothetical protein
VKRILAIATAAVLSAGALVAAGPAQAAEGGTCTIKFPSTLVITNPVSYFKIPLGADCAASDTVYAAWTFTYVKTGESVVLDFDSEDGDLATPNMLEWLDTDPFGTFTLTPAGAENSLGEAVGQNTTSTVVKTASKASQVVTRNGSNVTVKVGASYYNVRTHRQIPWVGAAVQIQTASALNGTWTTIATVTTGADGTVSKAFKAPSARYWRVLTPTTRSVFGRYSVPVYK